MSAIQSHLEWGFWKMPKNVYILQNGYQTRKKTSSIRMQENTIVSRRDYRDDKGPQNN